MPELPEVETVVRDLRPFLTGRRLDAIRVSKKSLRKPWRKAWSAKLVGRTIDTVRRRGKWIILDLRGAGHLVVHLGMTGQFRVHDATAPLEDHTHLVFQLDDARELRFRDIRRFGSATLFDATAELDAFFATSKLGPEPFDLIAASWRAALNRTDRCIKAVLLDQSVVAGVGNIYADESLFEAKLHPARLASSLSAAEAERLRKVVGIVLNRAIDQRGSSIRNYVGGSGLKGAYQKEFRAYGRTGSPCSRCRTAIVRVRLAGRSTHFCPRCQSAGDTKKNKE